MTITKKSQKINEKIAMIKKNPSQVVADYAVHDDSVQAELRLRAEWAIKYPVDHLHYPRNMGDSSPLWADMSRLVAKIGEISMLKTGSDHAVERINLKTLSGPERRADAKAEFELSAGQKFLADYKSVTGKKLLAAVRMAITDYQAHQKLLTKKMREHNSAYLAGKKIEREVQSLKNHEALASGRFWEADKETLKAYFHPPFSKNFLADVSERWRAALFLECDSISYKWGDGNWGHKLGGTGAGYLCGIDDNGDEWGHRVGDLPQSPDQHGNVALDSTVAEAMCNLYDIAQSQLDQCTRQGDLLFRPCKIRKAPVEVCARCGKKVGDPHLYWCDPTETEKTETLPPVELTPQETWDVMESHRIWSPGLRRNGNHFASDREIVVEHTSHETIYLPPGEYRLHTLPERDAD